MKVFVSVPATTSNLGPGFDVLGMALGLRNELRLEVGPRPGPALIEIIGEGAAELPRGEDNLLLRSFRALLPRRRFPRALRLRLLNRIPLARGLGSSAAARLCGLLAAAAVSGAPRERVLGLACRLEGHPDNVVPALFGGLRAAWVEGTSTRHFALRLPRALAAVVCVPELKVPTARARAVLPARVPLADAARNGGRLAFLLGALERGRLDWLRFAMGDALHQPYRKRLVPGMEEVIAAALRAGAWGASLSGSGSAMLALTPRPRAAFVGSAMVRAFARRRLPSRALTLEVDRRGALVR